MNTGVYTITNKINGKMYVGSAAYSFNNRWAKHRRQLRNNIHDNPHLQRAYNKHGEDSFIYEILEVCSPELAVYTEQYWLNMLNVTDNSFGYNIRSYCISNRGLKHSAETKVRMSIAQKNRKSSEEVRMSKLIPKTKKSHPMKGKKLSQELIDQMNSVRRQTYFTKNGYYPEDRAKNVEIGKEVRKKFRAKNTSCRIVLQYTIDGKFIREHISATEAAKFMRLKSNGAIYNCCNGVTITSFKHIWKWKNCEL